MIHLGFHSCYTYTTLFIKSIFILLLYMDDMIIIGNDEQGVIEIKNILKENFDMFDLGFLRCFLGIEVAYSPRGYILSQMKLSVDIYAKSGITDDKKVETPEVVNAKLRLENRTLLDDPTPYRQLIGLLTYLTITRPDITRVHSASQFQHASTTVRMSAALQIVRYIKNFINKGFFLSSSSSLDLLAYIDADWGENSNDRVSTTGFCVF